MNLLNGYWNITENMLKTKNEYINCKECNNLVPKYKKNHIGRISVFCDRECHKEYNKKYPPTGRKENHPNWKGDDACYTAQHQWIARNYGKASKCENKKCKNKSNIFEWANISKKYMRDRKDYRMLCKSCHNTDDRGNICKRGHKYTKSNSYINPTTGDRACIKCIRMKSREWWIKNGEKVTKNRKLKRRTNELQVKSNLPRNPPI